MWGISVVLTSLILIRLPSVALIVGPRTLPLYVPAGKKTPAAISIFLLSTSILYSRTTQPVASLETSPRSKSVRMTEGSKPFRRWFTEPMLGTEDIWPIV